MSESPWGPPRQSTVTIKYTGGYDSPWLVLAGSPADIRAQMIEAFGWDASTLTELSLSEMIVRASTEANALFTGVSGLGGTIEKGQPAAAKRTPANKPAAAKPASSEAPTGDEAVAIVLKSANTLDDLKKVWTRNSAAITASEDLQKLWNEVKARIDPPKTPKEN